MTFGEAIFLIGMLIGAWFGSLCSSSPQGIDSNVQDACSITRYQDICIHSLMPYSNTAKRDPSKWARAGVSVTIDEAKLLARFLAKLKSCTTTTNIGERNRVALSDCVELFQDTLDNLHSSLDVLRNFTGQDFSSQMEDVMSWLSAALTDEDTCLEGFSSQIIQKVKRFRSMQNRVLNLTYMTSNALALVNKLATTGTPNALS